MTTAAGSTFGMAEPVSNAEKLRWNLAAWLFHDQQRETLHDEHGRKGDHDRLQAQNRHKYAVERADRRTEGEACQSPNSL